MTYEQIERAFAGWKRLPVSITLCQEEYLSLLQDCFVRSRWETRCTIPPPECFQVHVHGGTVNVRVHAMGRPAT